jgi:hypothetical protein
MTNNLTTTEPDDDHLNQRLYLADDIEAALGTFKPLNECSDQEVMAVAIVLTDRAAPLLEQGADLLEDVANLYRILAGRCSLVR